MAGLLPLLHQRLHAGPLTFGAFMELCLYHPTFGYYTTGRNFSQTPALDFLTAPEHTPLFGAALAHWVSTQWQQLGQPQVWQLVEAGPGRGSLSRHLVSQLMQEFPACAQGLQLVLLETSPALTQLQSQTLQHLPHQHVTQLTQLANLPTLLIGNELLDAFPTEQFQHQAGHWQQLMVSLNQQQLELTHTPCPAPPLPAGWQPAAQAVLEVSPSQTAWLQQLKALPQLKAALLLDYGYTTLPPQGGDTLQAIQHHQPVSLLHAPGATDLTAHVNFAQVAQVLGHSCTLQPLAEFLLQHHIITLGLAHPAEQAALQRLLHPAQMGNLFKVLCYTPRP